MLALTPRRSLALLALLCLPTAVCAQNAPATQPAHFSLDEVLATLEQKAKTAKTAWQQFFDVASMTCGVYRVSAGSPDNQSPHTRDEIYYVMSGRGKLEVGGTRLDANKGSVLFVPAGVPHRFVEVEEDLTAFAFFATTDKTIVGGPFKNRRPSEQIPYDEQSTRGATRIFYWYGRNSSGQVTIDYGRPDWQPKFDSHLTAASGTRWRFGENSWTRLDTNIPLTIGGTKLEIGEYYLVAQNHAERGLELIALDPQEIRKQRLDAYEAQKTSGGLTIPVEHQKVDTVVSELTMELAVTDKKTATLTVKFGPHRLTAPVELSPIGKDKD